MNITDCFRNPIMAAITLQVGLSVFVCVCLSVGEREREIDIMTHSFHFPIPQAQSGSLSRVHACLPSPAQGMIISVVPGSAVALQQQHAAAFFSDGTVRTIDDARCSDLHTCIAMPKLACELPTLVVKWLP